MPLPIEHYALIGDCHAAALVGRDGSIDWLCVPRFDSGACLAALLGDPRHGRWLLAPGPPVVTTCRRYRDGTLILETEMETVGGAVRIIDFMPLSDERWDLVRIVEGLKGTVAMRMELIVRFDYGSVVPWTQRAGKVLLITAGPDTLELSASVAVTSQNMKTRCEFDVAAGERQSFVLNYRPSHLPARPALDARRALGRTQASWKRWSQRCTYHGRWRDAVERSLITLKALIYEPTGGIVAAPTTSLPEQPGGVRNWDYRYCWLRDSTFTLNALLLAGYHHEAAAWREWLLRAVAGSPADLQILYGITGTRRLQEYEIPWLPGYGGATPVRVGNAASRQFQLDVYGEVMDTLHLARRAGLPPEAAAWQFQLALLEVLESRWREPDEGIWEIRGPRRHFVHSKVMAWVAFDRALKDGRDQPGAPCARWRAVRDEIHAEICERGFDRHLNAFVQSYGTQDLDSSLLLMSQVGFLPPDDPRIAGTVAAIERHLMLDGLVLRYSTATRVDGLPAGEGAFLPCTFWLADSYLLAGRRAEAGALLERLIGLANDVGLLAEEFDPRARHMLGNFPQALTHVALVNSVHLFNLPAHRARHTGAAGEHTAALPPSADTYKGTGAAAMATPDDR